MFLVKDADLPAGATCSVSYHIDSTWTGEQQVSLKITNLSSTPTNGWGVADNTTDPSPANFLLNGKRCAR